jgi:hypothetical protein
LPARDLLQGPAVDLKSPVYVIDSRHLSKLFLHHQNNTMMKNNKTFEAAGLAGIAVIFAAGIIICAIFFQQVVQFILSLQISGFFTNH